MRFLWCCCSLFLIFILLLFICWCSPFCCCSSFTFSFRCHSSPFRRLLPGFYNHFILSVQPIAEWFMTLSFVQPFLYLLAAIATALSGHFLPVGGFYLTLLYRHFNLHLWILSWEPAVLPWSLKGFILILETQTRSICLFDSQ